MHPKHPDYLTCSLGGRSPFAWISCETCDAEIEITTREGALVELDRGTSRVHLCARQSQREVYGGRA